MKLSYEEAKKETIKKYEQLKKEGVSTDKYGNDIDWVIKMIGASEEFDIKQFRD